LHRPKLFLVYPLKMLKYQLKPIWASLPWDRTNLTLVLLHRLVNKRNGENFLSEKLYLCLIVFIVHGGKINTSSVAIASRYF
jgi:hypothetical protein